MKQSLIGGLALLGLTVGAPWLQGREGVLGVPDDSGPSIGAEGGLCPACGASVPAAVLECPECGLVVGGE